MNAPENKSLFDLGMIYDHGFRIAKAMPQWIKPGTSEEFKRAVLSHAKEAQGYVTKVEQIFECFGHYSGEDAGNATGNT